MPGKTCSHCLPDCVSTLYSQSVSATPLRRCDTKNIGLTMLCKFDGDVPLPAIWSHQGRPIRSEGYEVRWNGGGKGCWCRWWCQIFLCVHSLHARQGLLYVKVNGLPVREVVRFYLREGCRIIKYDIEPKPTL